MERSRYTISKEDATPAKHIEPRRGCPPHRLVPDPFSSHCADDALCHGAATRRVGSLASLRYRQPTHGHPHPGRERSRGPRCHAQSTLLEALREYWRGLKRKPADWLFPGGNGHTSHRPITPKTVYYACCQAAQQAGLQNRVHPHTLRHYLPFLTMSYKSTRARFPGCLLEAV